MAGTVPGAKDIKSNYTDSILKKYTSREEDMHVGWQLPSSEMNRMMTITLVTAITHLVFTLYLAFELSASHVLQHLPFPTTQCGKSFLVAPSYKQMSWYIENLSFFVQVHNAYIFSSLGVKPHGLIQESGGGGVMKALKQEKRSYFTWHYNKNKSFMKMLGMGMGEGCACKLQTQRVVCAASWRCEI